MSVTTLAFSSSKHCSIILAINSEPRLSAEGDLQSGSVRGYTEQLGMATPLVTGLSVAAAALGGRFLIQAWHAFKARPYVPRMRRFYPGGFEREMTPREAALILGVRQRATVEMIKDAHKRVMIANHPDRGGSHFLASKINEAKDRLLGKHGGGSSVF